MEIRYEQRQEVKNHKKKEEQKMRPFDLIIQDNSYEVIVYDSIEDVALIEAVFIDTKDRFLLVKKIKYINGKYQFDFIEGFRTIIHGYEAYQKRVNQYVEVENGIQYRKEGTE